MKSKSLNNLCGLWSMAPLIALLTALCQPCAVGRAAERQILTGHVPAAVARLGLKPLGRLPATNQLRLAIGLPLRNTNALNQLLEDLYHPSSPRFRQYLTLEQFTDQFGPAQPDYEAVVRFALSHNLAITGRHPNRVMLNVEGSVADIEKAFHIHLLTYQHPTEARTFYAPDREPSVDAGLAVQDIEGLSDYARPRPASHRSAAGMSAAAPTGSGPGQNFMGKDLRNAYVPGVSFTGAGQSVGLVEFGGFYAGDITSYETMAGLPNVALQTVLLEGFNGIPTGDVSEAELDIEMAISMAPGLNKVVTFDPGPNGSSGSFAVIISSMAEHTQIKQFSCSWAAFPPSATLDNLWKEMAAQGQSFLQASGDADSWQNNMLLEVYTNIMWPEDDAYVTSVGGTSLVMNGAGSSYASQSVWNWGNDSPGWNGSGYIGSGGGISSYSLPSWQQGLDMTANQGSMTLRNYPDVAMLAENYVIWANGAISTGNAGTSFAAPLWAGFTALVNEAAAANNQPPVGFLNPAIYALGKSAQYTNCFHDVTVGNNATPTSGGLFQAVPGYDLCTGWGTPNGSNLIYALALPERLGLTTNLQFLFTGSPGGPFSPDSFNLTVTNGNGFSLTNQTPALAWSLGVDADWLTVGPTTGTNFPGAAETTVSIMLNNLATNLAAGNYTATLIFTNLEDQSVQSRTVSLAIVTLPQITSQPTNLALPEGTMANFSVSTASNAWLSYQWQFNNGSGFTNLSDGSGIAGSATSSLTVNDVTLWDAGQYAVVISNASGMVTSESASLEIITNQAPTIATAPTNLWVLPGAPAAFAVTAVGDDPVSYCWLFNGTNLSNGGAIAGASSSTLKLSSTGDANAGSYSVIITNNYGAITSSPVTLNVSNVTSAQVAIEVLYSFTTNAIGCNPVSALLEASNGDFYGTANEGGAHDQGTVFQMTGNGTVSPVFSFPSPTSGNNALDGSFPQAALIQGTNGYLYGSTTYGGADNNGTIFRMSTSGFGLQVVSFTSGATAYGALVQGRDGYFYGTTVAGGDYGFGTVFKFNGRGGAITNLHSFTGGADGSSPAGTLVQGLDGDFYGTTYAGGLVDATNTAGFGTIFKINPAGRLTTLFTFANTNGASPFAGLIPDQASNFYGTTYSGGTANAGTVFKLAADGTFASLYSFSGGNDGSNCYAGLLLANDGYLYGVAQNGGLYGVGTVFRISTAGQLATLVNFDSYQGAYPDGNLIQATNGDLYGTTEAGGAHGWGSIFRISINGPLQITEQPQPQQAFAGGSASFSVATFGTAPVSYQWLESGTNLTDGGNLSGSSTSTLLLTNIDVADAGIYSVVVSNANGVLTSQGVALTVLSAPAFIVAGPDSQTVVSGSAVSFSVAATGDEPLTYQWQEAGTNLVDGGIFSGTATPTLTLASTAPANAGTFSVMVSNALNSVNSLGAVLTVLPVAPPGIGVSIIDDFSSITNPANPRSGVVQAKNGSFYGTSLNGGDELYGTVFLCAPSLVPNVQHAFTNGPDGGHPWGGLVQASDVNFYGASVGGFGAAQGVLYRLTPSQFLMPLYSFSGGVDGSDPEASLVQASDGLLYGTASAGGTNGLGTLFSLSTHGEFTPLWSFDGAGGAMPLGALIQAADGDLYGTTSAGGASGNGTIFRLTTNGMFTSLASFNYTNGSAPNDALVQAADGAFYGTASSGGTNGGWGTVFRLTTNGLITVLHCFDYDDGANPLGGLLPAADGNLYGTTSQGGAGGEGTLFRITTNGVLMTLLWFNGTNGAAPAGTLIQARNGWLVGTAQFGGSGWDGYPGSGNGLVFAITVPMFLSNPILPAGATATVPYSALLSSYAVVSAGDVLTFAKLSGPPWLNVATNGALTGTPSAADLGTNSFTVSLADPNGWSGTATLIITVQPSPWITMGVSLEGANLQLSWSGRQPPYQLQMATNLEDPVWQNIGGPTTNTTLLVSPTNNAAFYRIQGQ